jgi:transposase-like protein
VVHLKRNILNKIASKHKEEIASDLKEVFDLDRLEDNKREALRRLTYFASQWKMKYRHIGNLVDNEMNELYFSYLNYHPKIRRMIDTTNWIERLNKEFKRTFKNRDTVQKSVSKITNQSSQQINLK